MSQLTVNSMFFRDAGIGDYRVEQQIDNRLEDSMTPEMAGFTDRVATKVMVRSRADEEVLNRFVVQALRCCFAGGAFLNETEVVPDICLNGCIIA